MRKLIVAGIVTVLLLVSWTCYMQYNTKKFIEELPQEPPPKPQVDGNKKDSRQSLVDEGSKTTQSRQENTTVLTSEEKQEDSSQPNESGTGTGREVNALDLDQTTSNNGISPELKKVFTEIRPIYKQMKEIVNKMRQGNDQIARISQQQQNILSEVDSIDDEKRKGELQEEYNASIKLERELGLAIIKLQDDLIPFETELRQILSENGFQSQLEFERTHMKTYETWVSEQ